ncbi:MAG TPA: hypothetical protein VMW63_10725 [Methanoregulaceae archaeon]|nr:hypothetical protein [Methanoregulaceae archaeon]
MIAIRYYRIYDIGREIDLNVLERDQAITYPTARTQFLRVKPKSIMIEDPPLILKMDPVCVEKDGQIIEFTTLSRVYDIGAISLCFVYEDPDGLPEALEKMGILFAGQEGLSEAFRSYIPKIEEILKPHIKSISIDQEFYEDYTVFVTDHLDDSVDPASLLIGERNRISEQMREEIVKNSLSYTENDLAILSWDSALLCNPEYPLDLIELIEFANVQVLELRYYDREMMRQMEKMYDDIEHADRLWRFRRMRQYHEIMAKQMEIYAEISEITEKVNNLIKVTEDIYYARVYATALKVLRSNQWSGSVSRKIEVVQQNYSMLSDEVRIQHSYFLEWIIIILIALEFGLAIWQSFG